MILDRSKAPLVHNALEFDFVLPAIEKYELKNKIPVYALQAGVQEVVEINWVFDAGIWYNPKLSVAQATAALLKNGTIHKTAAQINEQLEFYGASFKINSGNDYCTMVLHCMSKHIEALVPLIFEVITEAAYPQTELDLYKQNTIQRIKVNLLNGDFVANQKIDAALFGEHHPYGQYSAVAHIEALCQEDLIQFKKHHYTAQSLKIFIAGNFEQKHFEQLCQVFEQFPTDFTNQNSPIHKVILSTETKQFFENDPNAVQAAIRVGRTFIDRNHPDFFASILLNTLFGGYFGSRLMSNIREDKGYTYGIYSSIAALKHESSLIIQTEVGKEVWKDTLKEIYYEMEQLGNTKIDEEELLLVKNYLLGSILGDFENPFALLQKWRSLILSGFDEQRFYNSIKAYKNTDATSLQHLAQQYFNPKDFIEVVVL